MQADKHNTTFNTNGVQARDYGHACISQKNIVHRNIACSTHHISTSEVKNLWRFSALQICLLLLLLLLSIDRIEELHCIKTCITPLFSCITPLFL